ncbi:hypothetical protein [Bacillus sp. RO1]|uniref:hypothetical protein n=1 Tax=Bacillus sp. RO1 TaxID=2722703 RepID=UPI001456A688|nr:hypothetical protein [Bacillus sp. RO1]NLP50758.1 hypothetical protein [Bacillus sp. RO1]
MKSIKNDEKIILQQKIIHLGAEVKRLTADVKRLNSKSLLKNIEKQKDEYEIKIHFLKDQLEKLQEEGNEKVSKLQGEIAQYKGELAKQKEEHQGKLVTISKEVHHLKQEYDQAMKENKILHSELATLKKELDKQSTINMDLEKEYEMVKETVKGLLVKIESSNQAQEGYHKIAEVNNELELENQNLRKIIAELEEEINTQSTTNLEEKKPSTQIPEEDPRIQSWFYNNVKKDT